MPISLQCAECKTVIEVNDSAAGKYAKCRKCGNLMRVPGDAPAPKFKVAGGNGSSLKWLLVGGAAIALTAGGVFAWSKLSPPRARVTQAAPVAPEKAVEPGTPAPERGGKGTPKANPANAELPRIIPDSPMKEALLDAPEGSLATGAILNPAALLTELRRNIDATTKGNAAMAGSIGLMISQVQAQTGLDLNNTQSLGIAGLDLSKPVTFSLLVDAADPQKGGFAAGAGLSDAVQFRAAMKNLFQKAMQPMQQLSAAPELYRLDDSSCVALDEKRVFVIVSDSASLLSRAQEFLRKRKQQRLVETEQMAVALHGADALNSSGALYVDLPRVLSLQKRGEPLPLANELRGLAFAMSGAGAWFLQLNRDAALHQLLKPGPSPRAMLERFETPLATVCFTLADPVKLLQHTLHASKQSNELIRIDSELRTKTNLGLADLDEALKNSSAGFMLFKGNGATPFSGVLFLKPGNRAPSNLIRARALLDAAVGTFNEQVAKPGQPIVIPRATLTEIDGTLFATTDPQLLASYQHSTGSRWKAQMAPDDILFLEYRAGEAMQHLKRINPQMAQATSPVDPNSVFTSGFKRLPEGVKYYSSNAQVDVATLSIAAAVAIPALLRSRMAANEAAAGASARYYMEAQAIYHRMDRDGDGVLEYAQSIGKEYGLARMEISQGQKFLEEKYALAEGNPNDLTTPVAGYCIKLLKGQGDRAKSGRMSYITGKDQVLGHAAVFYPKKYDNTGRTTFIVNQDGVVYGADLGIDTSSIVEFMTEFNPGPGWTVDE